MSISRRSFLEISALGGGGLLASIALPGFAQQPAQSAAAGKPVNLGVFVRINPDNTVVIGARGCEIGQGVLTSLPMLIAEELDVRWDQVRVEQLPYGILAGDKPDTFKPKYGGQGAGGSTNISDAWGPLREAGAQVRTLLVAAAARRWNADAATLRARDGAVTHPDGRKLEFGALAAEAAKLPLPEGPFTLKQPKDFRIIGKATKVADCADIVSGRARYGIDASMPGMLYAVIARCPFFDGKLGGVDDVVARKVRGVRAVIPIPPPPDGELNRNLAAGVAVVADNTWAAMQGRKALKIDWQPGPWSKDSTDALEQRARAALGGEEKVQSGRSDGDMPAAWASAAKQVQADYRSPFLAHATMEPPGATISIEKDRAKLIASLQSPGGASRMISEMTGISRLNIDIELPRSGGGFGRRLANDFVAEAVQVARALGKPVKILWTRDDDLQNDFYRPFGMQRLRAAVDANGEVTGWAHRVAATSRKTRSGMTDAPDWVGTLDIDGFPASCVPNYLMEFVDVPFGLARGWWRAPLPTFAAFATQSFVDEVAAAIGRDPLELRLEMLGSPRDLDYRDHGGPKFNTGRLAATLREAAKRIGNGRKLPKGHGIGFASHFTFGGYASHAFEVATLPKGGWRIERCVVVGDIGIVVNPSGAEAQMAGGTIDGISTALGLEITVKDGRVEQRNFNDYTPLRIHEAPQVEVHLLPSTMPPCGAGEMGIPGAAPALANAVFAATGTRLREMPFRSRLGSGSA
jgi:isoquinoline 1-oxidoreductase beta subunit